MPGYPENPVLIEYRRGGRTESVHRGAYAIVVGGELREERGATDHAYFLRSAAKLFQALPLVESGAADRFGLSEAELALVCASHNGEDVHAETAASLLKKGGLSEAELRCGTHPPFDGETAARIRAAGDKLGPLRHNCSGKHGGMLLLAKHLGQTPSSYLDPAGPAQRRIRADLCEICEVSEKGCLPATDGCSAPTYAIPLRQLALGFSRLANPDGLRAGLREACARVRGAIWRNPYLFAGRGQLDTEFAEAGGGRILGKRGAEGVYGLGISGARAGIALKVDDGGGRMHAFLLLSLLERHALLRPEERSALARHLDPVQRNFAGLDVGEVAAVFP